MSLGLFVIAGVECHPRNLAERYELVYVEALGRAMGHDWRVAESKFEGWDTRIDTDRARFAWRDAHRYLALATAERAKKRPRGKR